MIPDENILSTGSDEDNIIIKDKRNVKNEDTNNTLNDNTATDPENTKRCPSAESDATEIVVAEFENSPDISENTIQQENDLNLSLTEQEKQSVKGSLANILNAADEHCKISKDDIKGCYVVDDKIFVVKDGLAEDRDDTKNRVKEVKKSLKEVKAKCIAAVEKLPKALV